MNVSPYAGASLKRSFAQFMLGKGGSALITFVILLWLVRLLPVDQYGLYITLVAALELSIAVSGLGMQWLAGRYLPEYRLHASGTRLNHFVLQFLAQIVVLLIVGTLLIYYFSAAFLSYLELSFGLEIAHLYTLMLLIEGGARHVRESLLGPLMQQGWAQVSLIARNACMLAVLVAIGSDLSLDEVIWAEVATALIGLLIAGFGLVRYLQAHRNLSGSTVWRPPGWREMWPTARHMYFSQIITLAYSPQVCVFLVQRHLGVEATALFGFLRNLYDQAARYLPATLLFSVIRPKLVASYVGKRGVESLSYYANMAGKLSLFVLMPLVVMSWWVGPELVQVLSGGKFVESGYYLAGLMLVLIPLSQRQIVETVAVTLGRSYLCTQSALWSVLSFPLIYGLLYADWGLWAPILGLGVGNLIFNSIILSGISRTSAFRIDRVGVAKLFLVTTLSAACVLWIPYSFDNWQALVFAALLCVSVYLVIAGLLKPFSPGERASINRFMKLKLFVW